MSDWDFTDLNSRLIGDAYSKSSDYPQAKGLPNPAGQQPSRPLPAAPPAPPSSVKAAPQSGFNRPGWYYGPKALRPESVGNLALYYLEKPGAKLERPLKFLRAVAVLGCLATGILLLALVSSNPQSLAGGKSPATVAKSNRIGIVNPAWVEDKFSRAANTGSNAGFYDSGAAGLITIQPPPKFVYVAPEVAQQYLNKLISLGYVTATGGTPDIARDFQALKGMGITVDDDGHAELNR